MIKFVKRIILLCFLVTFAFFYISVRFGGESFRVVGETVRKGTADLGETADLIKESSDGIRRTVSETADAINKTSAKIKETTGKVSRTVKVTGEALEQTSENLRKTTDEAVASLRQIEGALGGPETEAPLR